MTGPVMLVEMVGTDEVDRAGGVDGGMMRVSRGIHGPVFGG